MQVKHRQVKCTIGMYRKPDSVIWNIGVPVFLLTIATLLMFTIPVSDGQLKDERLNIAFIAFLTFITLKIVMMELLPALPYTTFMEEYILYAIGFVAAVAASNSIMLTNVGYDDEEHVKEADRYSMWASFALWAVLHAWVTVRFLRHRRRRLAFLKDNALEVAPAERTFLEKILPRH